MIADARNVVEAGSGDTLPFSNARLARPANDAKATNPDKTRQSGASAKTATIDDNAREIAAWLEPVAGEWSKADWKRFRAMSEKLEPDSEAARCCSIQSALRLNGAQQTALAKLLEGATVTEAARASEVSRQTLSYWLNHDYEFQAALSHARADIWQTRLDAMQALGTDAISALRGVLNDADVEAGVKVRAALGVLALLNAGTSPEPKMPGDFENDEKHRANMRIMGALV